MLRASFWTSLLLRSSRLLCMKLFIAILLTRSAGTALQSHSVFFCQETCYHLALPLWFSVVLLGYSLELLAFHVGLLFKPKYLLNSLKTEPLIVFTLAHLDSPSLFLSLYGTPKLPCTSASASYQVLEDILSGSISWSAGTPWHGWQCLMHASA